MAYQDVKKVKILNGVPDIEKVRQKRGDDIMFESEDKSYVIVAGDADDLTTNLPLCIQAHGRAILHINGNARQKTFPYKIFNADGQSRSTPRSKEEENGDDPEIIVEE